MPASLQSFCLLDVSSGICELARSHKIGGAVPASPTGRRSKDVEARTSKQGRRKEAPLVLGVPDIANLNTQKRFALAAVSSH